MRYHRFPQVIVVDGGLDFSSVYFESLLAHYGCILKVRPGKKPRFGTLIERLFLTTHKQFIYNLIGNTQLAKDNVRYLIKDFNPKNLAAWTIGFLHLHLCRYLFEVYDKMEHSTLGVSPREMFEHGLAQFGERKQRFIKYDENFKLMTLPTTKLGVAKVFPGAGIVVNYILYRTEHFRNPQVENKKVPVRFDPFDAGIAYAYVNGMWRHCLSDYFNVLKNRSEREIQLATAEIRERRRGLGRFTLNAKILAEFLLSVEASENELLLMQRQKDLEIQQLLNASGDYSDYQLSSVENKTLKLLSGQSEPISSDEQDNFTGDEDDSLVDISTLKVFGDY